ncbi:MAG: HD domain-containing protein [Anaerolineae bacterium]|nr:HD domain-containing protein [Anaerolineae bacterium]
MPRLSVSQLRAGMRLEKAAFMLATLRQATDRNGDPYLKMTLRDKTGDIEARFWRVPQGVPEQLSTGEGVAVTGSVSEYRGSAQVNVSSVFPYKLEEIADYLPTARRPAEEMIAELQRLINSIKEPHLKQLLREVLGDPAFQARFFEAAAAKMFHHACVGGLLEHSLDVARQVVFVAKRYPEIDRDLAATAALLHDIGKVDSYVLKGAFDLTDAGRLLGHVYLGAVRVDRAIDGIEGFPAELRLRLMHAVLAAHGELAKGAVVTPRTPEAIVLHHADELDAGVRGWVDHVQREDPSGAWTSWSTMHEGELYVGVEDEDAS